MSWSAPDWIYSRGETNPPGDNRFESQRACAYESKLGTTDDRESVSEPLEVRAVSRIRNQADTRGHRRTGRTSNSSTAGTGRTPQDTRGHGIAPVRDREAPGSN